jgi:hypothetical protein
MRPRLLAGLIGLGTLSCGSGPVDTDQECKQAGGRVVPAPGGPAMCAGGEEKIGDIPFGIEGAICCRPVRKP